MKSLILMAAIALGAVSGVSPAYAAACFPAASDVVSLGEGPARAYAERSLEKHINEQKQLISSRGETFGRILGRKIDCKPFPNLLGANEWQCVGKAKVCAGK